MAIALDALVLPQGLRWEDEFAWSPLAQTTEYTLAGSLVVEQSTRQAGRSITLVGGKNFAWMTRVDVASLKSLLDAGAAMTLTLHDDRTFTVIPAADEPLAVSPLSRVRDSGVANPGGTATYVLESLKLIEV